MPQRIGLCHLDLHSLQSQIEMTRPDEEQLPGEAASPPIPCVCSST